MTSIAKMRSTLNYLDHSASHLALFGHHPHAQLVGQSRGCKLRCHARAGALSCPRRSSVPQRQGRRVAVVCTAAARSFYDILSVTPTASSRDIKSAYRKLAMKLHPDVNKAPDAQQRFMEAKVAYETLSDSNQRAEYDRRLRMGGFGSYGARTGGSSGSSRAGTSSYGGPAGTSSYGGPAGTSGSWGPYGPGAKFTQESVPGLDELLSDLEKEFTAWVSARDRDGKSKSLLEELEDLGGELLDFLEESLGIKDEQPATGSGPTGSSNFQGQPRDAPSAADRFDNILRQYGNGTTFSGASSNGGTAGASSSVYTSGAAGSMGCSESGPRPQPTPSSPGASTQSSRRSDEDDIEAQLLALKKKLNKL
ncbi:hypothetical protein VaNZ11_009200 [Volvox africanus]|uniref:J domain-containing protein n=1 Tax=Volvox africanus TaxID=51714 RepID=A0ABQ5S7U7_9CHLO|nr:hypothetical protein VaNZ11_009200 [Volvox africanus]